jgi:DNA-binding MarR family transcriptional regulator
VYLFGDLLALARAAWVAEMRRRLGEAGYGEYHRSDAAVMRLLLAAPSPIGRIGTVLGVTRQAARKIVDGLERRGYVTAVRDEVDARQLNAVLTVAGRRYAEAVVAVLEGLNRDLAGRTRPAELAAADSVLRAAILDPVAAARADRLVRPPAGATPRARRRRGPHASG